jgi:DNA mismatch repair protein MLH3
MIPFVNPLLAILPSTTEYGARNTAQQHSCQSTDLPRLTTNQNSVSTFFSKEDLSSVKIIGQVDKKFIACLIAYPPASGSGLLIQHTILCGESTTTGASALVLIDQHAADERVRVECFLKELCLGFFGSRNNSEKVQGVRTLALVPPKPILLTSHELQLLNESIEVQEAFGSWGICFAGCSLPDPRTENPMDDDDDLGLGQILVETIPDIVSDKVMFHSQTDTEDTYSGFLWNPSFCKKTSFRIWSRDSLRSYKQIYLPFPAFPTQT